MADRPTASECQSNCLCECANMPSSMEVRTGSFSLCQLFPRSHEEGSLIRVVFPLVFVDVAVRMRDMDRYIKTFKVIQVVRWEGRI